MSVDEASTDLVPYDADNAIWHLRMVGRNWDDIRAELADNGVHYTKKQVINRFRMYTADLDDGVEGDQRAVELTLELERLQEIIGAWWEEAVVLRDKDAVKVVLDAMKQRERLLKLDLPDPSSVNIQQAVLITGESKDEWIAALTAGRDQYVLPGVPGDDSGDAEETR